MGLEKIFERVSPSPIPFTFSLLFSKSQPPLILSHYRFLSLTLHLFFTSFLPLSKIFRSPTPSFSSNSHFLLLSLSFLSQIHIHRHTLIPQIHLRFPIPSCSFPDTYGNTSSIVHLRIVTSS